MVAALAFAAFLMSSLPLLAESTISCPAGTIDILDWMTLDADLRASKHMAGGPGGGGPLYTVLWPDKYFYLKTPTGDTADINLYNGSFVYMWLTELQWNQPYDFKKSSFDFNWPMVPRCATPGLPGSTSLVPDSRFDVYQNCTFVSRHNLKKVIFQLWGPYTAGQPGLESWRPRIGGNISDSTPVYVLQYRYGCDNSYNNCPTSEEFVFTQRHGLVRWEWLELQSNGQYASRARSNYNYLVSGTAEPFTPCFESLQSQLGPLESVDCEHLESEYSFGTAIRSDSTDDTDYSLSSPWHLPDPEATQ